MEWLLKLGNIASILLKWLPKIIKVTPDVKKLIDIGQPVISAVTEVMPEALPVIRRIAGELFPSSLETHAKSEEARVLVAKALFAPHKMTFDEEKRWMDRASGGPDAGG